MACYFCLRSEDDHMLACPKHKYNKLLWEALTKKSRPEPVAEAVPETKKSALVAQAVEQFVTINGMMMVTNHGNPADFTYKTFEGTQVRVDLWDVHITMKKWDSLCGQHPVEISINELRPGGWVTLSGAAFFGESKAEPIDSEKYKVSFTMFGSVKK